MNPTFILISLLALGLGIGVGFFVKNYLITREVDKKQNTANQVLNEAERKSTEIVKESQNRAIEIVQAAEKDSLKRRQEITRYEERLQSRSDQLDRRAEKLEDREHAISQRQSASYQIDILKELVIYVDTLVRDPINVINAGMF